MSVSFLVDNQFNEIEEDRNIGRHVLIFEKHLSKYNFIKQTVKQSDMLPPPSTNHVSNTVELNNSMEPHSVSISQRNWPHQFTKVVCILLRGPKAPFIVYWSVGIADNK